MTETPSAVEAPPVAKDMTAVEMAALIRGNVQAIVGDLLHQHAADAEELDRLRQAISDAELTIPEVGGPVAARILVLRGNFSSQIGALRAELRAAREVCEAAKGWLIAYEEEVRNPSEEAPCKRLVAAVDALNALNSTSAFNSGPIRMQAAGVTP